MFLNPSQKLSWGSFCVGSFYREMTVHVLQIHGTHCGPRISGGESHQMDYFWENTDCGSVSSVNRRDASGRTRDACVPYLKSRNHGLWDKISSRRLKFHRWGVFLLSIALMVKDLHTQIGISIVVDDLCTQNEISIVQDLHTKIGVSIVADICVPRMQRRFQ